MKGLYCKPSVKEGAYNAVYSDHVIGSCGFSNLRSTSEEKTSFVNE